MNKDNEMLIDFMIMGAMKSGTTALFTYLAVHPQIFIPSYKELHFFDTDRYFDKNINYKIYHDLFMHSHNGQLLGDGTHTHMYQQECIPRIKNYNPDVKMIFILRNPVERAYSHYNLSLRKEKEDLDFLKALELEKQRKSRNPLPVYRTWYSYIEKGLYVNQIKYILNFFPLKQMHFIKTENLKLNFEDELKLLFDFLNIEKIKMLPFMLVNFQKYLPVPQGSKEFAIKQFKPDILELEKLLNWDCSDWYKI